jgi:(4S)-4-hydroxy-5-phosphonooxypentane-2,3-dione isomerase
MFILVVHARVRPDHLDAFREATLANARESRREPGVARFDVLQDLDDPSRFTLVEVYRTPEDPARHKETAHYARWRDTVEGMLAEPRTRARYRNLDPGDAGWEMPGA